MFLIFVHWVLWCWNPECLPRPSSTFCDNVSFLFFCLSCHYNLPLAVTWRGMHYPTPFGWRDERPWGRARGWFFICVTYICQHSCIIFIFRDVWFFRWIILYLAHFLCLLFLVRICSYFPLTERTADNTGKIFSGRTR